MKPCDSCQQATALFFCTADEAYLCTTCDAWIHNANILSFKHKRLSLCEVCLETPATVTSAVMPLCTPCEEAMRNNEVPVLNTEKSTPSSESVPLEAQPSVVHPSRPAAQEWTQPAGNVNESADVDEDDMLRLAEEAAGWLSMDMGCLEGSDGSRELDCCGDLALTPADVEGTPSQDASEEEGNEGTAMNESEVSNTTTNKDEGYKMNEECTKSASRQGSPAPADEDKTSTTTSPAHQSDSEAAVVPKQEPSVSVKEEPLLPPPLFKGGLLPPLSFDDVFDSSNAMPPSVYCQEVSSAKEGHDFPHPYPPHPPHQYYHVYYPHPLAHPHSHPHPHPHPHIVRSASTQEGTKQNEAARKRIKTSGSFPSLSTLSSNDTSASPVSVPSTSGSSTSGGMNAMMEVPTVADATFPPLPLLPLRRSNAMSETERGARVQRYREKRQRRKFAKTIRYASRKEHAESRPRIKGRFARRDEQVTEAAALL